MSAWVATPAEADDLARRQWDLLVRLFGDDALLALARMREIDAARQPSVKSLSFESKLGGEPANSGVE